VAVLVAERGAADPVPAQPHRLDELPGGLAGRVFEEGAGVAAARLGCETAGIVVFHALPQLCLVAGPERDFGPQHRPPRHQAAREGTAAINEAKVSGFQDAVALVACDG